MTSLLLLFLSISSFSCIGALYKKRYEETIPITVIGIMVFLYLFYIFNLLNFGFLLLIALIIITYVIFAFKFSKKNNIEKKEILKCIFTPGFVIYLLGFLAIYILTMNNEVLLWDELRLWGAYPKILFYDGSLQLGDSAYLLTDMRSYNPGMPLFMYFVTKMMGVFKESLLFFAYALVGYSILLPISKNITWKRWIKIPFYVLGLLLIPLLFANSNNDSLVYYYTLFIEPVLGIIFGYSIYLTFNNIFNDKFKYLLLLTMIAGMVLFKDTGILFSITVGVSCILCELFNYKTYKKTKYGIVKLVLIIIIPLLIFGSWKGVQSLCKSGNMYTSALNKNEIVSLFSNPNTEQKVLLSESKKEILFTPVVKSNFSSLDKFYTFPFLFICLLVFLISYIVICGKKEIKKNGIPIFCFIVGSCIFFLGTLFVYFFSIHTVASFPRYMSLIFTAGSVLLILLLCEKYDCIDNKNSFKIFLNHYTCTLLVFCLMVLPIRQPKLATEDYLTKTNSIVEEYSNMISENVRKEDDVLLVFAEEHEEDFGYVIYHHQIYLDLLDEGFYSFEYAFLGENNIDVNSFGDYDYVYFIVIDEIDKRYFEIVTDSNIDNSSIFRVVKIEDDIKLAKVG